MSMHAGLAAQLRLQVQQEHLTEELNTRALHLADGLLSAVPMLPSSAAGARPEHKASLKMSREVLLMLSGVAEQLNQTQAEYEYRLRSHGAQTVAQDLATGALSPRVQYMLNNDIDNLNKVHAAYASSAAHSEQPDKIEPAAIPAVLANKAEVERWGYFTSAADANAEEARAVMRPTREVAEDVIKERPRLKARKAKDSWQQMMAQRKREAYMAKLQDAMKLKLGRVQANMAAKLIQRTWRKKHPRNWNDTDVLPELGHEGCAAPAVTAQLSLSGVEDSACSGGSSSSEDSLSPSPRTEGGSVHGSHGSPGRSPVVAGLAAQQLGQEDMEEQQVEGAVSQVLGSVAQRSRGKRAGRLAPVPVQRREPLEGEDLEWEEGEEGEDEERGEEDEYEGQGEDEELFFFAPSRSMKEHSNQKPPHKLQWCPSSGAAALRPVSAMSSQPGGAGGRISGMDSSSSGTQANASAHNVRQAKTPNRTASKGRKSGHIVPSSANGLGCSLQQEAGEAGEALEGQSEERCSSSEGDAAGPVRTRSGRSQQRRRDQRRQGSRAPGPAETAGKHAHQSLDDQAADEEATNQAPESAGEDEMKSGSHKGRSAARRASRVPSAGAGSDGSKKSPRGIVVRSARRRSAVRVALFTRRSLQGSEASEGEAEDSGLGDVVVPAVASREGGEGAAGGKGPGAQPFHQAPACSLAVQDDAAHPWSPKGRTRETSSMHTASVRSQRHQQQQHEEAVDQGYRSGCRQRAVEHEEAQAVAEEASCVEVLHLGKGRLRDEASGHRQPRAYADLLDHDDDAADDKPAFVPSPDPLAPAPQPASQRPTATPPPPAMPRAQAHSRSGTSSTATPSSATPAFLPSKCRVFEMQLAGPPLSPSPGPRNSWPLGGSPEPRPGSVQSHDHQYNHSWRTHSKSPGAQGPKPAGSIWLSSGTSPRPETPAVSIWKSSGPSPRPETRVSVSPWGQQRICQHLARSGTGTPSTPNTQSSASASAPHASPVKWPSAQRASTSLGTYPTYPSPGTGLTSTQAAHRNGLARAALMPRPPGSTAAHAVNPYNQLRRPATSLDSYRPPVDTATSAAKDSHGAESGPPPRRSFNLRIELPEDSLLRRPNGQPAGGQRSSWHAAGCELHSPACASPGHRPSDEALPAPFAAQARGNGLRACATHRRSVDSPGAHPAAPAGNALSGMPLTPSARLHGPPPSSLGSPGAVSAGNAPRSGFVASATSASFMRSSLDSVLAQAPTPAQGRSDALRQHRR